MAAMIASSKKVKENHKPLEAHPPCPTLLSSWGHACGCTREHRESAPEGELEDPVEGREAVDDAARGDAAYHTQLGHVSRYGGPKEDNVFHDAICMRHLLLVCVQSLQQMRPCAMTVPRDPCITGAACSFKGVEATAHGRHLGQWQVVGGRPTNVSASCMRHMHTHGKLTQQMWNNRRATSHDQSPGCSPCRGGACTAHLWHTSTQLASTE
jgi:hypothetical protein